jgi:hypothetical protein
MHNHLRLLIVLLIAMSILSNCGRSDTGQSLSFQTIDQGEKLRIRISQQGNEQPAIYVIATQQEADTFDRFIQLPKDLPLNDDTVGVKLVNTVRQVDYNHNFVIIALRGVHGSGGYRITIQDVAREANDVRVQAELASPGSGVTTAVTDAYHIVAVAKNGTWGAPVRFLLMDNGKPVAETTHNIP